MVCLDISSITAAFYIWIRYDGVRRKIDDKEGGNFLIGLGSPTK